MITPIRRTRMVEGELFDNNFPNAPIPILRSYDAQLMRSHIVGVRLLIVENLEKAPQPLRFALPGLTDCAAISVQFEDREKAVTYDQSSVSPFIFPPSGVVPGRSGGRSLYCPVSWRGVNLRNSFTMLSPEPVTSFAQCWEFTFIDPHDQ